MPRSAAASLLWKQSTRESGKSVLNPALLPMKTHLIHDFRGVALGLLLGTSFASTKRIVRGIFKGGPALRASMFIYTLRAPGSEDPGLFVHQSRGESEESRKILTLGLLQSRDPNQEQFQELLLHL